MSESNSMRIIIPFDIIGFLRDSLKEMSGMCTAAYPLKEGRNSLDYNLGVAALRNVSSIKNSIVSVLKNQIDFSENTTNYRDFYSKWVPSQDEPTISAGSELIIDYNDIFVRFCDLVESAHKYSISNGTYESTKVHVGIQKIETAIAFFSSFLDSIKEKKDDE